MPEISFKEIRIHFEERGRGPAVVLLHGFLEGIWIWEELANALSRKHRVVMIDLPGHGQSDCIGYVHSMDEMAESVHAVLNHLRLRRVTLAGHSMGGYVALAFAEHYPDMIKTLVLYHSTARADSPEKKRDRNRVIEMVKRNPKPFVRRSIPMLFRPVNRKRYRDEIAALKQRALQTPVQGIIAALAGMRDRPDREILLTFPPYPVHIIAGDKDPRIPYRESLALAAHSEQVRLHTLRGCGHMGFIEDHAGSLEAIRQALV